MLEARAVLDRPGLAAMGVVLPEWLMDGQGAADLRLDLPDGVPGTLRATSDLAGIALSVPALGWQLGQAATGTLRGRDWRWGPTRRSRRSRSGGRGFR